MTHTMFIAQHRFARATVTVQERRSMVWVTGYVPERHGRAIGMIEEPIELREVHLEIAFRGRGVRRVFLAPEGEPLPFVERDRYTVVTLPLARGRAVVVFEDGPVCTHAAARGGARSP